MTSLLHLTRTGLLAIAALLAACGTTRDLAGPAVPLGDFYLGHNIVLDDNAIRGPLSREAGPGEWQAALTEEMDRRFRRFEGGRLYHLAVNVEAYVLALPGIPLVAAPRSVLIFTVSVWDDLAGRPINPQPYRITVTENPTVQTLLGSGLTQPREAQMRNLAQNAAHAVEAWLRQNAGWFEGNESTIGINIFPVP